jgi:hypothetical protein
MSPRLLALGAIIIASYAQDTDGQCVSVFSSCAGSWSEEAAPSDRLPPLRREGRCLVSCLEKVLGENGLAATTDFGLWRSFSSDELMTQNCTQYSKVRECVLGCTLGRKESCTEDCVNECNESCSSTRSCSSTCESECSATSCQRGCEISLSQDAPPGVPPTPTSFSLTPIEDESGRFRVTSATAPNTQPSDEVSAFLFRINENHYILQVSSTVM